MSAETETYRGLSWIRDPDGPDRLVANSTLAPVRYAVDYGDPERICSLVEFGDAQPEDPAGWRPGLRLGTVGDLELAILTAERYDYEIARGRAAAAGMPIQFRGSDRVQALVSAFGAEEDGALGLLPGDHICPNGRPFSRMASYLQAKKSANKQNADGSYALTLTVPAREMPVWLAESPMGMQLVLGAVGLGGEDEEDQSWSRRGLDAFKRSHTLPDEPEFQEWMASRYDRWGLIAGAMEKDSEAVATATNETLKRLLGIPSRRDLRTNRDAVDRLERLDREYYRDLARGFGTYVPPDRAEKSRRG